MTLSRPFTYDSGMVEWCIENCDGRWSLQDAGDLPTSFDDIWRTPEYRIRFADDTDAMLFHLRFA